MGKNMNIGLLSIAASLILAGCGGGSSPVASNTIPVESDKKVGYFIDAPVAGADYNTSSGLKGTTDSEGKFEFHSGDKVEFRIGKVILGEAKPKVDTDGSALITPKELADGNETAEVVMLQVLQSLDSDRNATNGIEINATVKKDLEELNTTIHLHKVKDEQELIKIKPLSKHIDRDHDGQIDIDDEKAITHFEESLTKWQSGFRPGKDQKENKEKSNHQEKAENNTSKNQTNQDKFKEEKEHQKDSNSMNQNKQKDMEQNSSKSNQDGNAASDNLKQENQNGAHSKNSASQNKEQESINKNSQTTPEKNTIEKEKVGKFIDSEVVGADYNTSSGLSGTTDSEGRFKFHEGDKVEFRIGKIILGEAKPVDKNGTALITPEELAEGNESVKTLMLQFLQSLDSDRNATNGIEINTTVKKDLKELNTTIHLDKVKDEQELIKIKPLSKHIDRDHDGQIDIDDKKAIEHFQKTKEKWFKHKDFEFKNKKEDQEKAQKESHDKKEDASKKANDFEEKAKDMMKNHQGNAENNATEHQKDAKGEKKVNNDKFEDNFKGKIDTHQGDNNASKYNKDMDHAKERKDYKEDASKKANDFEEKAKDMMKNHQGNAKNNAIEHQGENNATDMMKKHQGENNASKNAHQENAEKNATAHQGENNATDMMKNHQGNAKNNTIEHQGENNATDNNEENSTLTDELQEALIHMDNEERLAYDVYTTLYNYHKEENNVTIKQLDKIAQNSETKHIKSVKELVEKYNLETTTNNLPAGEYDRDEIQALYNDLIEEGKGSTIDALEVGCKVEVVDVNDLNEYIELAKESNATDVQNVFEKLRAGSYNHYWAFDKALKDAGIETGCCSVGDEWCHLKYPNNNQRAINKNM